MENNGFEVGRYRHNIRNWWVLLIVGLAVAVVGVMVFFNPGESFLALGYTFAVLMMITGAMQLYLAWYTPPQAGRGWLIAGGMVELLLGIMLVMRPASMVVVLPFFLGFWMLFRSISLIGYSSDMMAAKIKGSGWVIALAVLLLIAAMIVLFNPVVGAGAIVIWVGISLLIAGFSMIVLAFQLNRLRRHL